MGLMRTLFGGPSDSELRGPVAWLQDTGGGRQTTAGVKITPESVMSLSAVFACIRAVAEDCAKVPLKTYRRLDGGGKEVASDEPTYADAAGNDTNLYHLLRHDPNPEMGSFDLRQALVACALLYGKGPAEIERDGAGRPIAVWPLEPGRVKAMRDGSDRLFYRVTNEPGEPPSDVAARDMVFLKGFSLNGIVGEIIAMLGRESLGVYLAAELFTGSFFGNGATTTGVISFTGVVKEESIKKYRTQFEQQHVGARKAHRPLILDNGGSYTATSTDPEKSQLVETLQFRVEDVARWFRVPPHKIGHLLRAGYNSLEQQDQAYLGDALDPWLVRLEEEFTRKLIAAVDRARLVIEHERNAILRTQATARAAFYNLGIRGGWMTPNEARERENLNPYKGGERFRVEQNLALLDEDGRPEPTNDPGSESGADQEEGEQRPPAKPPEEEGDGVEAIKAYLMPVFVDAAERMIEREAKAIAGMKDRNAERLAKFYDGHRPAVADAFRAPIASLARIVEAKADGIAERYADQHVGESQRRLNAGENPETWPASRPAWIAKHLTDTVVSAKE
jgi:HK97 family phage portal protein